MFKKKLFIAVVSVLLLMGVQSAFAAKLSTRVSGNPFQPVLNSIKKAKNPGQFKSIVGKIGNACKALEIVYLDGCPDYVSYLQDQAAHGKNVKDLAKVFNEQVSTLNTTYTNEYGGEERKSAKEPAKLEDLVNKHGSVNLFKPLLDWVNWWDLGSFYAQTIRNHQKVGAPKVLSLMGKYCTKLEGFDAETCNGYVTALQEKVKKDAKSKTVRREIIYEFKQALEQLNSLYERQYMGENVGQ